MGTITVRPADQVPWADVEALFRSAADPARCWCQRYKMAPRESWASFPAEERAARLQDEPGGLLAYVDGEPVGWCAVEPRNAYPRLVLRTRVAWDGRDEDRADGSVWAVTCFVTRPGRRRRGISRALARAAVDHARERGARAVEGYPMISAAGSLPVELHVGLRGAFEAAGFRQVSHPTERRVVMRIDL
jgi:GNAT superfamily N-acetyltransferase